MPPRKTIEPQLIEMPSQKMAVMRGKGAPDKVLGELYPAIYGSVYTLKFALKKQGVEWKVPASRARYPDAHLVSKNEWTIIVGVPVPEDTTTLPQKVAGKEVELETWEYGTVAQALHLGSYSEETPTIEKLHRFIKENGYEIAGVHEEEYLTRPTAKVIKTIIRYPVKKSLTRVN